MNDYIKLLKEGIENIPIDYFCDKDEKGKPQYNERVFCYELYHQLRSVPNSALDGKKLDGEIPKKLRFSASPHYGIKYDITEEDKEFRATPDMVIHKAQENRDEQSFILEVKNSPCKVNVKWDIIKLLSYIEDLKFEIGVYLQINIPSDTLIKQIKESFDSTILQENKIDWEKYFKKTIIMTAEIVDNKPQISHESLDKILE